MGINVVLQLDLTVAPIDRPISTSVLVCFLTGITLLVWSRFVSLGSSPSPPTSKRPTIPHAEQFELPSRASTSSFTLGDVESRPRPRFQLWWIKLALLLGLCGLRIESFRQVTRNTECAPAGYTVSCRIPCLSFDFHAINTVPGTVRYSFHYLAL